MNRIGGGCIESGWQAEGRGGKIKEWKLMTSKKLRK